MGLSKMLALEPWSAAFRCFYYSTKSHRGNCRAYFNCSPDKLHRELRKVRMGPRNFLSVSPLLLLLLLLFQLGTSKPFASLSTGTLNSHNNNNNNEKIQVDSSIGIISTVAGYKTLGFELSKYREKIKYHFYPNSDFQFKKF